MGSLLVRAGSMVLLMPIALRVLEPAEIAVWQLFVSALGFALMFDLGLAPTTLRMVALAQGGKYTNLGADPTAATRKLLATQQWLYPRLALVAVLLIAGMATPALIKPISQCADARSAWLAWGFVLIGTWASFVGNGTASALQGMDCIALVRRWEMATGLAQTISGALALLLGGGLLGLIITYQVFALLGAARNRWLLQTLHPELKPTTGFDKAVFREIWPATWRSGLGVLLSHGLMQLTNFWYAQVAPATQVAAYLLALRLITLISQLSQAPFYSQIPKLARMAAGGARHELQELAQLSMRRALWIFSGGAIALLIAAPAVLKLIGSKTPLPGEDILLPLALAFFFERYGAMHLQLHSLGNVIVWHIANGITAAILIAALIIMYPLIGAMALPVSMLIAYALFYAIYCSRLSLRSLGSPRVVFERRTALFPALFLAGGLALHHCI